MIAFLLSLRERAYQNRKKKKKNGVGTDRVNRYCASPRDSASEYAEGVWERTDAHSSIASSYFMPTRRQLRTTSDTLLDSMKDQSYMRMQNNLID